MRTAPAPTVDETHADDHGPLSELIFLLRTYEDRLAIAALLLQQAADENTVLRAWNRTYHEQLYGSGPTEPK